MPDFVVESPSQFEVAPPASKAAQPGIWDQLKYMVIAPPSERDKSFGEAVKKGVTGVPAEIGREFQEGAGQIKKGATDKPIPQSAHIGKMGMTPVQNIAEMVGGATEAALSIPTGAATSAIGRPVEEATGLRRGITGNLITAAIPLGWLAKGAKVAEDVADAEKFHVVPPEEPPPGGSAAMAEARGSGPPKKTGGSAGGGSSGPPGDEPPKVTASAPIPASKPSFIIDEPKPGETQDLQAQRWDDASNRLQTNDDASKMEASKWVDELPPDLRKPDVWERVYTQVEERLKDPTYKLTPEAQRAYDAIKPWADKQTELAKWIKAHGGVEDEEVTGIQGADKGYARRVVAGRGHVFDRFDPASNWERDPIRSTASPGAQSLSRYAPSVQTHRQFYVLDDGKGGRIFLKEPPAPDTIGKPIKASDGSTQTVKPATTQEIEANTPVRYHKNFAANTIDNVIRLERVKNNMEVLDKLEGEMTARGLIAESTKGFHPDHPDWIETRIPQFRGKVFPPEIAEDLDQVFRGDVQSDLGESFAKVNRLLNSSIYWQPFSHQMNILNDFIIGRGWDWATPGGYVSILKNGTRAIKAFTTRNADYVRYLREGASLHYPGVANRNFYNALYQKFGQVIERDPVTWAPLAERMGFGKVADAAAAVRDMVKAYYGQVSKVMWATDDMLKMTRMFEYESRGLPAREAIRQTEKEMANYRIAPRIAGGRMLTQLLKSPNILRFGRYDGNKVRILSGMFKDLTRGSREEKVQAAGKFLAMAGMMYFIYPALDQVYKSAFSGTPGAMSGRHGITGVAYGAGKAVQQGAQGDWSDGWQQFIHQIYNLSGTMEIGGQLATGKDDLGRPIIQPGASPLGQGVEFGEWIGSQFGPAQTALQAAQPGGVGKAILRNVGGKTDTEATRSGKVEKIIRGQARSREKKDAIERALRNVGF